MTIATVITSGYGSFGSVPAVILSGYYTAATPQVTTIDTHDGFDSKRDEEILAAKLKLREQLRYALEGPLPEALTDELEAIATPQQTDARYVPLSERIDWDALVEKAVLIDAIKREAAIESDDEEILGL